MLTMPFCGAPVRDQVFSSVKKIRTAMASPSRISGHEILPELRSDAGLSGKGSWGRFGIFGTRLSLGAGRMSAPQRGHSVIPSGA